MTRARKGSSGPFATSSDILNASSVAGVDVTAALDALLAAVAALQPAPIVSQIGWAPASLGTSNVLTLLAAGHAPGIYEIDAVAIVRTVGTGSQMAFTLTWNSPSFGAESKQVLSAGSWASLGTVALGVGNGSGTTRQLPIHSDGSAAITLQYAAGTITAGAPVADLYGSAHLVAE